MTELGRIAGAALLALLLTSAPGDPPDIGFSCFPADNPWNWDVSGLPVDVNSAVYINSISSTAPIREDYSFPYNIVAGSFTPVDVTLGAYADESDPGPTPGSPVPNLQNPGFVAKYRFPAGSPIEGGGVGDAHCLVVDVDNKFLYETYQTSGGPPWSATFGAVFNLNTNAVRPDGWTSGDAAGLPIFPGLLRYEEVKGLNQITHALRFTCNNTQNKHIYPARHHAGSANVNYPPMGTRVRLKASTDLSGYSGVALKVLTALKKHGLILADNGSNWYISTTIDTNWGTSLFPIRAMYGSDFEVVQSVDGTGAPILPVTGGGVGPPPPPPVPGGGSPGGGGGGGGGGGCGFLGLEVLVLWALRRRRESAGVVRSLKV